jgi:hypothetical protein
MRMSWRANYYCLIININGVKVKVKVVYVAYSEPRPRAYCTLSPEIVPSFISRGAPHQPAREFCKQPVILPQMRGSFTCPKVGTWGRLFNFPSEGRHAEDFYI